MQSIKGLWTDTREEGRKERRKGGRKEGEWREKDWGFREELMNVHLWTKGCEDKGSTGLNRAHIVREAKIGGIVLNPSTFFIGLWNSISVSRENLLLWIRQNDGAGSSLTVTWQTHS